MPPYLKGWLKIMQACLNPGTQKTVDLPSIEKEADPLLLTAQPLYNIVISNLFQCRGKYVLIITQCFRQLLQRFCKLSIIGGYAMPFVAAFHKINPFTHGCFHYYNNRLALAG